MADPGPDLGSPAGGFAPSGFCVDICAAARPVNVVPIRASAPTAMTSRLVWSVDMIGLIGWILFLLDELLIHQFDLDVCTHIHFTGSMSGSFHVPSNKPAVGL
jgi:hypothetical protein